ncbi:MAG: conjugal transfer protein TraR [Firmicutes bacterium]|nr:conjugal transfer protein TraR [Bacillota bacterium]
MDQVKLQYFEDLLWKRYTELQAVEERLAGPGGLGEPATSAIGELAAYDQHPADLGSEVYERSKDLGLLANTRRQLGQIEEALNAIERGTYGICRLCGGSISEERLEAIPETDRCVACSSAAKFPDTTERPVEETSLAQPLGRSFTDEQGSWEAVADYGTASSMPKEEKELGGGQRT